MTLEPGAPGSDRAPWDDVWSLYFKHTPVFRGALASLRASGMRIQDDEGVDLVHEFLMERAPYALATFRPERGKFASWLFVVFKRFVIGTRRCDLQRRALLDVFGRHGVPHTWTQDPGAVLDLEHVSAVVRALPREQQQALQAYLSDDGGTLRAVARTLRSSRWRANRLVAQGMANVARELGVEVERSRRGLESEGSGGLIGAWSAVHRRQVSTRKVEGEPGKATDRSSSGGKDGTMQQDRVGIEKAFDLFLAAPDPDQEHLRSATARAFLELAAEDERRAAKLADSPGHAQILLEKSQLSTRPPRVVEDSINAEQTEIQLFAKGILCHVPDEVRNRMALPIEEHQQQELWALSEGTPAEVRASLAVSELILALRSFLAGGQRGVMTGRVTAEGLALDDRAIPPEYFAARIAQHASLQPEDAKAIWQAFLVILKAGRTGLPGLHAVENVEGGVVLLPADPQDVAGEDPQFPSQENLEEKFVRAVFQRLQPAAEGRVARRVSEKLNRER